MDRLLSDHFLNLDDTSAFFDAFDQTGTHQYGLDTIFHSGDVGIRRGGEDLAKDTQVGTAVTAFAFGNLDVFGFAFAETAQGQGLFGDDVGVVGVALIVDVAEIHKERYRGASQESRA